MNRVITKRHHEAESHDCCGSSGKLKTQSMRNDAPMDNHEINATVSFLIDSMTCMSCVNKIENALLKHPGVNRVNVDLAARSATIHFNPKTVDHERLKSAIEAVGYTAKQNHSDIKENVDTRYDNAKPQKVGPYPFLIGIGAAIAVVGFYLGLLTLTSDWYNAKMQFIEYRLWSWHNVCDYTA